MSRAVSPEAPLTIGAIIFCMLVARVALHIGGFWELRALQDMAERAPLLAWFFPVASITKDPWARQFRSDLVEATRALTRALMLIVAALFSLTALFLALKLVTSG
jgi:hypothetical protein